MKVLVAGAAGVVGNRLVPLLVRNGYEVTAMTRSGVRAEWARRAGAEHLAVDGLDREAVLRAVANSKPDAIIHQMTALTGTSNLKEFDRDFAVTNRLRIEGTDHLLEAARENGVRRFIAQSYGNWNYARSGIGLKTEMDPLDPSPCASQRQSLAAIRYLESAVTGANEVEGLALRYGNFYGPRTGFAPDGDITAAVRRHQLPVIGAGTGVWSFVHVDDAASATLAAITHGQPGVYNIADDEPAPVNVWLPEFARIVGAKPPMRIPVWLGRTFAGEVGVSMMTQIRGASNRKAKEEFNWQPHFASWRAGFQQDFHSDQRLNSGLAAAA